MTHNNYSTLLCIVRGKPSASAEMGRYFGVIEVKQLLLTGKANYHLPVRWCKLLNIIYSSSYCDSYTWNGKEQDWCDTLDADVSCETSITISSTLMVIFLIVSRSFSATKVQITQVKNAALRDTWPTIYMGLCPQKI